MIESIEIENLRGIAHGKLEGLTPLTILVGPNGSGKSTILEALYLGGSTKPNTINEINHQRNNFQTESYWLIHKPFLNNKSTISIQSNRYVWVNDINKPDSQNNNLSLTTEIPYLRSKENSNEKIATEFNHKIDFYIKEIILNKTELQPNNENTVKLYSKITAEGKREYLIKNVQSWIPNLSNIEILILSDKPSLYFVFNTHSVPVSLAGDGIFSLLMMSMKLSILPGGIALVEEPEAHLHPALIHESAKIIYATIRRGVQVILTTHSVELIDALLDAATEPDDLEKLSVFWVKLDNGELKTIRTPGEDVAFERENLGKDLR